MSAFLYPYHVKLLSLIAVNVRLLIAVAKLKAGTVREFKNPLDGFVDGGVTKELQKRNKMILLQLRKRTPEQKTLKSGIAKAQKSELCPHRPGFASSARSSVAYKTRP